MTAWDDIVRFAGQFDCLSLAGGMQRAMQLADSVKCEFQRTGEWPGSRADLEACLSFECRSWQHCGMVPCGDDLTYIEALYGRLRGAG